MDSKVGGKCGLFRLEGCGFAVPLERLVRVVDRGLSEYLPLTPDQMAGMLVLDDEIIPLLESSLFPGVSPGKSLSAEFKVLIFTEYGTVALPADVTVGIVVRGCCEMLRVEPVEGFMSEALSYRDHCYQVLDVDSFLSA